MNKLLYLKSKIILILVIFSFLGFAQSGAKFKVVLDAGHGAKDPGTQHNGHVEKKINLAIVLKVGEILENNPNIDVIYTRKTDVFIDLVERADIANRANANIFVSIHCDAIGRSEASGYQTFVMGLNKNASNLAVSKRENAVITLEKDYKQKYEGFDPNNPASMIGTTILQEEYMENSIALASKIQDKFANKDASRKNRGVTQAPFMVLHKASMPRVLIEAGFISNPTEGALLDSESGQQEIAEAIAEAITSYKREYFGEGAGDYIPEKPTKLVIEREETPAENNSDENSGIIFKIQIAAANKKIDTKPRNFKGLKNISYVNESGNFYKYMYGNTSSYETAKKNLEEAKKNGYKTSYIVAFKDGKKIDVKDAMK